MQATLTTFSEPAWQPPAWGSCLNCHARPHYIEAGVVYCKAADYHGPVKPERSCKHWWPAEPLDLWPPLAPNYGDGPKKWRAE